MGEDDKTVVGRVAAILDAVAEASAPVPLAELTRLTGIPKPTVRRIAASLVARGILGRTEAGYVPGGKMLRYGLHAMSRHPVALAVQPYLQDLHQRSMGEMAWFATAEAGELTVTGTVFRKEHLEAIRTSWWPSTSQLGNSVILVAAGRLEVAHQPERAERILAEGWPRLTRYSVTDPRRMRDLLADAKATGVAQEDEQTRLGWSCLAVILRDTAGELTGALGVTGRTPRILARGLRRSLLQSADELQAELHPSAGGRASAGDAASGGAEVVLDERLGAGYLLPAAGRPAEAAPSPPA